MAIKAKAKSAARSVEDAEESKPETVVPPQPSGKEETRLFQRAPDARAWLTEEQAKAEGFFWAD